MTTPPVILASASTTRAALLRNAGIAFDSMPARVDETEVKEAMRADGAPAGDAAQALADLKAQRITASVPGALVIGADQILECEGTWYDKPKDRDGARGQLLALAGRSHELWTAAAVAKDGAIIWRDLDHPRLTMRALDEAAVDRYLNEVGETVLQSVGGYQVEGPGVQLFSAIKGDFFAILGLPLLSLLSFLREQGAVSA